MTSPFLKVFKAMLVMTIVIPTLPVWILGFLVKTLISVFVAGQRAYVDFYYWLGGD